MPSMNGVSSFTRIRMINMNDNWPPPQNTTPGTTWVPNNPASGWNPLTPIPLIPQQPIPFPVSVPGGAWYSAEAMKILIEAVRAAERATFIAELEELKRQQDTAELCRECLAQARADVEAQKNGA